MSRIADDKVEDWPAEIVPYAHLAAGFFELAIDPLAETPA